MAEDFQYQVTFRSTASGDGAAKTIGAINEVEAATRRAAAMSTDWSAKVGVENTAFYDLDAALRKTTPKIEEATKAKVAGAGAARNYGTIIGQAGYQAQDFAVQVGMGTSAVTALSQQGSQLLGAFGPQGAMAGAVLALGAIAYKVFSNAEKDAREAAEEAKLLADAIKAIGDAAGEAKQVEIDLAGNALESAQTQIRAMRDMWKESDDAARNYETARLKNAENLRVAKTNLAKLNGQDIDEAGEILAKEEAAAAARNKEAADAKAAQEQRRNIAQSEYELAAQKLVAAGEDWAKQNADLQTAREKLGVLREQLAATEKIASYRMPIQAFGIEPTTSEMEQAAAAREAQKRLDGTGGAWRAEIAKLDAEVGKLESALDGHGRSTNRVEVAAERLTAASREVAVVGESVETNLATIEENLAKGNAKERSAAIVEASGTLSNEIGGMMAKLESRGVTDSATIASVKQAIEDGLISADETRQLSENLRRLASNNATTLAQLGPNVLTLAQAVERQDRMLKEINQTVRRIETNGGG